MDLEQATISVEGKEDNFAEIITEHIGKRVYVFTNFLGTNTPQIPIIGVLDFVGPDAIIVHSDNGFWILLYRIDIAYVVFGKSVVPPYLRRESRSSTRQTISSIYASDIVYANIGKKVDVFLNFMGSGPNVRQFEGEVMFTGNDFFIVNVVTMGGPLLIGWTNLAYMIFREKPALPDESSPPPHQFINVTYLDIAKENINRQVTVWTYFVGHSPPERRILIGKLLVVGANAFIIGAKQIGGPTMIYYANIAYVSFNEGVLIPRKDEQPSYQTGKLSIGY